MQLNEHGTLAKAIVGTVLGQDQSAVKAEHIAALIGASHTYQGGEIIGDCLGVANMFRAASQKQLDPRAKHAGIWRQLHRNRPSFQFDLEMTKVKAHTNLKKIKDPVEYRRALGNSRADALAKLTAIAARTRGAA